jgi:hypothetical protein
MKNTIITGVMAATILLTGCGKKSGSSGNFAPRFPEDAKNIELERQKLVDQSQVIVYATANTNNAPKILLTVTEIWRGSHEASTLGITNGMQFPYQWNATVWSLPDGAILFFPREIDSPSRALKLHSTMIVQAGRLGGPAGMTTQEFKTKYGL